MANLKFVPTHRMVIKAASGTHGYDVVEIDIHNGTFKKKNVSQQETKIRVNKSILGEILNLGGKSKPLGLDEIQGIADSFNEARVASGYQPLVFRTEDEDRKEAIKEIKHIDAVLAQQVRDVIPLE
jgi:hypothetical protein